MKPMVATADKLKSLKKDVKIAAGLLEWLHNQLGSKDTASAVLEKLKHYDQIKRILQAALVVDAWQRRVSVLHECLQSIFAFTIQVATAKYQVPGFMPYGLGQWFVPLEGSLLIIGVPNTDVPGAAFSAKVNFMTSCKPDELGDIVAQKGFCVHCECGMVVRAPPGFICLVISLDKSSWVRWSSMCAKPTADSPEARQILSSTTMMISSYPVLGSSYKEWLRFLEVSTASAA